MLNFKQGKCNKKDRQIISNIILELKDSYNDFYITKNNLRLFIKENIDLLFEGLEKGDKIVYDNNEGIIFVTGFSDNASRKYIKILAKNEQNVDRLLKVLLWNVKMDLFIKIKKKNSIKDILKKNGFYFIGDRGREILLVRKIRKEIKGESNA